MVEPDLSEKKRAIRAVDILRKRLPVAAGNQLNILRRLHGLDINPTACHISCFSLYLAALEQMSPLDLEMLQEAGEKFPPLLLDEENGYKDGRNIVHANFFAENALKKKRFDLVIGNPPWVSRTHATDSEFLKWRSSQGKDRETALAPEKQMAAGFMRKVPEHLSDHGRSCLLLPTAVLLNRNTNHFQKEWLNTMDLTRVVNLSDLRRVLFERAIHPCIAICFSHRNDNSEKRICSYESPKFDIRNQVGGPVYIREEDVVHLPIAKIVRAAEEGHASTLWKSRFRGTWRDLRLIDRLDSFPKLEELIEREDKQWGKSKGITKGSNRQPGWWNKGTPYLTPSSLTQIVTTARSCTTVGATNFPLDAERPRKEELFNGPKVLVSKGALDMKVSFCDFPVIF